MLCVQVGDTLAAISAAAAFTTTTANSNALVVLQENLDDTSSGTMDHDHKAASTGTCTPMR